MAPERPSKISLNSKTSSGRTELVILGGAPPAAGRPLLAEKRGDASYAATAPTSVNSLNYSALSRSPELGQLGNSEPTTFGYSSLSGDKARFRAFERITTEPGPASQFLPADIYTASQSSGLPQRERGRIPSWYTTDLVEARDSAFETYPSRTRNAALGEPGLAWVRVRKASRRKANRLYSLPIASVDVGKVTLASSDESHGTVPKLEVSARVTGEAGKGNECVSRRVRK